MSDLNIHNTNSLVKIPIIHPFQKFYEEMNDAKKYDQSIVDQQRLIIEQALKDKRDSTQLFEIKVKFDKFMAKQLYNELLEKGYTIQQSHHSTSANPNQLYEVTISNKSPSLISSDHNSLFNRPSFFSPFYYPMYRPFMTHFPSFF